MDFVEVIQAYCIVFSIPVYVNQGNFMQADELNLVTRSQQGDMAAFNLLVERYQAQVFGVAARILGNPTSAEDVSQETFVSAYKALKSFRGGNLRAWLLRIASNLCYDYLRASKRRPEQSLDAAMEANPSFGPAMSESYDPEKLALQSELRSEIQKALMTLPADQRSIMVLVDVEGFGYDEAADSLGVAVGTVKSRLFRAREKVREYLLKKPELLPSKFSHQ
ncbi:MAG: sigma-70 family RNA polymerase sigma factor [SAR202 cluster bacterium]|nr:sigma-70 family RNA polymerase sigma factor [SAR202 cluster bacterium]